MKKNKLFFIIETRITSKRLPGKVLKKIFKNYLALDYVIKNILRAGIKKDKIIIATPKNNKNKKIWDFVKKKYKIKIFKGPEENVFKRVIECCKKYQIKYFARITSDNIMLDPIFIKAAIQQFKTYKADYISSNTIEHSPNWIGRSEYNEGTSIEILKSNLLEKIKNAISKKNYEYPTWLIFSKPKKFNLQKMKLIKKYRGYKIKKFRTTLDTFEDLEFLRTVSKKLNLLPGNNNFLKLIKKSKIVHPFLKINKKVEKKLAYKVIKKR